jgi:hypothetical protein
VLSMVEEWIDTTQKLCTLMEQATQS